MRAVEHERRGAGAAVRRLTHHQVGVFQARQPLAGTAAAQSVGQRAADIEIEDVAERIGLRRAGHFDAGRLLARVVTAERRFAQRAEQVFERLVAEEIEALVRKLETRPRRWACRLARARRGAARRGLRPLPRAGRWRRSRRRRGAASGFRSAVRFPPAASRQAASTLRRAARERRERPLRGRRGRLAATLAETVRAASRPTASTGFRSPSARSIPPARA